LPKRSDVDVVNNAGTDGWEMISISPVIVAILKRPIPLSIQEDIGMTTPRARFPSS
jgi:hypothetical protein